MKETPSGSVELTNNEIEACADPPTTTNELFKATVTSPNRTDGQATVGKSNTETKQGKDVADNGPFVTKTENAKSPVIVGVPEITPVDESKVKLAGKEPVFQVCLSEGKNKTRGKNLLTKD